MSWSQMNAKPVFVLFIEEFATVSHVLFFNVSNVAFEHDVVALHARVALLNAFVVQMKTVHLSISSLSVKFTDQLMCCPTLTGLLAGEFVLTAVTLGIVFAWKRIMRPKMSRSPSGIVPPLEFCKLGVRKYQPVDASASMLKLNRYGPAVLENDSVTAVPPPTSVSKSRSRGTVFAALATVSVKLNWTDT